MDLELGPYENFDTLKMLLMFRKEVEKISFEEDPYQPPHTEAQKEEHAEIETRLE